VRSIIILHFLVFLFDFPVFICQNLKHKEAKLPSYGINLEDKYTSLLDVLVPLVQKDSSVGAKISKHSLCKGLLEKALDELAEKYGVSNEA